ncbi:MAG: plus agglutinin protein [Candidatus Peregrinibacteria bacterium Greene1014_49]|nr:MAG: plus agglutinin protein [Candidatus Peregrinibacteria bacterium Greene1014_49]
MRVRSFSIRFHSSSARLRSSSARLRSSSDPPEVFDGGFFWLPPPEISPPTPPVTPPPIPPVTPPPIPPPTPPIVPPISPPMVLAPCPLPWVFPDSLDLDDLCSSFFSEDLDELLFSSLFSEDFADEDFVSHVALVHTLELLLPPLPDPPPTVTWAPIVERRLIEEPTSAPTSAVRRRERPSPLRRFAI